MRPRRVLTLGKLCIGQLSASSANLTSRQLDFAQKPPYAGIFEVAEHGAAQRIDGSIVTCGNEIPFAIASGRGCLRHRATRDAKPSHRRSPFTNIRNGRHQLRRGRAGRAHELLKSGEDTRISLFHVIAIEHVVVANSRIPGGVDGNADRVTVRRNYRGLRRWVSGTPVISAGMSGTRGQPHTGPPQTARQQQGGCRPHDDSASAALSITGNTHCLKHLLHLALLVPDGRTLALPTCRILACASATDPINRPTRPTGARPGGRPPRRSMVPQLR
jgi:hypothetical protein